MQAFRNKLAEIDTRLGMLQEAEDNYYITAKYLFELANRAYDLFVGSEIEERRQLIKLVLQNIRVDGKTVLYDVVKPFDTVIKYADHFDWLPIIYNYRNYFISHYSEVSNPALILTPYENQIIHEHKIQEPLYLQR